MSTFHKTGLDVKLIPKPHVSLSKVVVLQHLWIEGCVSNLRKSCCLFSEFDLSWNCKLVCFLNEEKTRTFLGLAVNDPTARTLSEIVGKIDNVFQDYKLDKFYDPPLFHVSLFWLLGDQQELIETNLKLTKKIDSTIAEFLNEDGNRQRINHLICQTGNRVFQINL